MTDIEDASRLLRELFGDRRFDDTAYLEWLYAEDHPVGPPVVVYLRGDDGEIDFHGAAIQQRLRNADRLEKFVLLANIVVRPLSQGQGLYVQSVLERAPIVVGFGGIAGFGVTNERSVFPSITALGGRLVGPLPVKVCPPIGRPSGIESIPLDRTFLDSARFEELAAEWNAAPVVDWIQNWDLETLRWRLARPDVTYVLHVGPDAVGLSVHASAKGVPMTALLKFWPRGTPSEPVLADRLVSAACLYHRTPFAVYTGLNRHVRVRGWRVPRNWLPAPLHLVCLSLSDLDQNTFRFETFEFLDFDAF